MAWGFNKKFFYIFISSGIIYKCTFMRLTRNFINSISVEFIISNSSEKNRLAYLVTHKFLYDNKDRMNYLLVVVTD
jgi:hypothetical protein